MKNKILPFSLLVLISVLLLSFTYVSKKDSEDGGNNHSLKDAAAYFSRLRNNQTTGILDARDVLKAKQQISLNANGGRSLNNLEWQKLGPDNFAGRTRALLWDNQDSESKTIFAGNVTGGIWKSTTAGLTWNKTNGMENNLPVSAITQAGDGTIFVGTGEWFFAQDFSVFGHYGYNGGLIGNGVYMSTDGETFTHLASTTPTTPNDDQADWIFVNELAWDNVNSRLYAATNSGLKYSNDKGQTWNDPLYAIDSVFYAISASYTITCDSIEVDDDEVMIYNPDTTAITYDSTIQYQVRHTEVMEGNALDVETASDGSVIAYVNDYSFVYQAGEDFVFENKANKPSNPYFIVKDSLRENISLTVNFGNDTSYQKMMVTDYEEYEGGENSLPNNVARIEFAVAPSDPNVMYASAVKPISGLLENVYYSDNKGDDWRIILPGASASIDVLGTNGMYSNTIEVMPNNPGKVLFGGENMWEGKKVADQGYFNWLQKSNYFVSPFNFLFCPQGHHVYAFHPENNNEVLIGTNAGIFIGLVNPNLYEFEPLMKNYMTTQFYTVGISGSKEKFMGGAQENNTILFTGEGNTQYNGTKIWYNAAGLPSINATGGYCDISIIDPDVFIYSRVDGTNNAFRRTEDAAESVSTTSFLNGIVLDEEQFLVPAMLWEGFNVQSSRDSVWFHANKNYQAGDIIQARSNNWEYPFNHQLTEMLSNGDSVLVKDIVQARYFLASSNNIYMTLGMHDFTQGIEWWNLANSAQTEFSGNPSCMAHSKDANHIFVGTLEGGLYRISNLNSAYNEETADCNNPKCVVATKYLPVINPTTGEEIEQVVTSVAVNPQDPNHVVVTYGNYGNEHYVFATDNALDSLPDFRSIQGDPQNGGLPHMPVYSSLIEMNNSDLVIIGTENGVYSSTNTGSANPTWTPEFSEMGQAPVMMLRQQLVKKLPEYVPIWNGVDTIWEEYPGTNNFGVIYAATYGRGLYRSDKYQQPVGIDENESPGGIASELNVYPNPVGDVATIEFELNNQSNVEISIYNLSGRIIQSKTLGNLGQGTHKTQIDAANLPKGTYLIRLISGNQMATGKFIVIK